MSESLVNWDNLKPYEDDLKKSFEELCFQIAAKEYQEEGVFTPIDDSGGGDGVEFYLTLENGDVWGWQAKFFGRLNESGRKEQIKKSLQTSVKKHPNLKKWFLCSRLNFTDGERDWFNNKLSASKKDRQLAVPDGMNIELIHWGDSEFLQFLQKYPDIHKYFFEEKILTPDWFKEKYRIAVDTSQIKSKYESQLHIATDVDEKIIKILGGKNLADFLDKEIENNQVKMYSEEYKNAVVRLQAEDVESEYLNIQKVFREFTKDKLEIVEEGIKKLNELKELLIKRDRQGLTTKIKDFDKYLIDLRKYQEDYRKISDSSLCKSIEFIRDEIKDYSEQKNEEMPRWKKCMNFISVFKKRKVYSEPIDHSRYSREESPETKKENNKRRKARDLLLQPMYALGEYAVSSLELAFKSLEMTDQNELHISGDAGMGKTHVVFNTYEKQISQDFPAIFLFAKSLRADGSIDDQIKNDLGVPTSWSFYDFLGALNIAGDVYQTKVPIIIDGLNEAVHWNKIWKDDLERLIIKIKQDYPNLVIITSYRSSYEKQLFPDGYFDQNKDDFWWKKRAWARGFENLTWEKIGKYFDWYKIKLENHSRAIEDFRHPLYLKIFCETKNKERQEIKKVSFQNEDLFEIFDEYFLRSNINICKNLNKEERYNREFAVNKLLDFAKRLWEENDRGISRDSNIFNEQELRAFEGENLLIFRDWNQGENRENISFTYDLLGGYLISKYLTKKLQKNRDVFYVLFKNILDVNKCKTRDFIKSREFKNKLINDKKQHPLSNDILRCFAVLSIKENRAFLFQVSNNKRLKQYSVESLFEINSKYIKENENIIKEYLDKEFLNQEKRRNLFNLSRNVELDTVHPLNFDYWSDLLKSISMPERDLSWSEYIRENHSWYSHSYFSDFVREFERACKDKDEPSEKIHIAAKKVMWVLTTNIRRLRDEATRALYWYSRKFPKEFLELLEYSLAINDPYVPERMFAVVYGLAMARREDLKDKSYKNGYLSKYAKKCFESIFSENAQYKTTHFLLRDYAKRTIDIALMHCPDLFTESEIQKINNPLSEYSNEFWSRVKRDKDKEGINPFFMDFENYTIGRLVPERRNYDSNQLEYKEILESIRWRVFNLGYSNKFREIDRRIADDSFGYRGDEERGKTDRYGKKYSWIAFFEMAGYRSDRGLLKDWDGEKMERISDADIDPSFPTELKELDLIKELGNDNFLGDQNKSADLWYEDEGDLKLDKYFKITKSFEKNDNKDWILLKGVINQKDKDDQKRDIHIAINAVFVSTKDLDKVKEVVSKYGDYQFDYIRSVEDYYLYEGEIPWCNLMQENTPKKFTINYNYRDVKKRKKELKFFKDDKEISDEELNKIKEGTKNKTEEIFVKEESDKEISIDVFKYMGLVREGDDELMKKVAQEMGYETKYVEIEYSEKENDQLEITTEESVFESSWESYHSEIIPSGQAITPSKNICKGLDLSLKPQSSDLYTKEGVLASTSFKSGKKFDDRTDFTYIREDLIKKYLKDSRKSLVWFQWAEKRFFSEGIKSLSSGGKKSEHGTFYKIII